jgi:hypothetical protein
VNCTVSTYPDRTTVKPAATSGGGSMSHSMQDWWQQPVPGAARAQHLGRVGAGSSPAAARGLKAATEPRPATHPTADGWSIHPHQSQPRASIPRPGRGGASEVPGPHRPVRTATMQPGHGRVYVAFPEPHSRRQADLTAWSSMHHVAGSPPARDRHGGLAANDARWRNSDRRRKYLECLGTIGDCDGT